MNIKSDLIELHVFTIENNEPRFLLLKRSAKKIYPGLWQMVSGHINPNETAVQTTLREMEEETGLIPVNLWVAPNINSYYSPEDDSVTVIPVFAAKVNLPEVRLSDEHTEFKWVDAEEAKKHLAWDGQRRSVDIIKEYLTNSQSFLKFIEIKLP
jgi:dihydroneopterin triphosphate diphosphatase